MTRLRPYFLIALLFTAFVLTQSIPITEPSFKHGDAVPQKFRRSNPDTKGPVSTGSTEKESSTAKSSDTVPLVLGRDIPGPSGAGSKPVRTVQTSRDVKQDVQQRVQRTGRPPVQRRPVQRRPVQRRPNTRSRLAGSGQQAKALKIMVELERGYSTLFMDDTDTFGTVREQLREKGSIAATDNEGCYFTYKGDKKEDVTTLRDAKVLDGGVIKYVKPKQRPRAVPGDTL